ESERDMILEDIGAMFSELGLHDAARDSHLILAATAQTRLARWTATVNLMELAAQDGKADAFDTYARELASEPLTPYLRAHYLLFLGEGMRRLGRDEAATDALQEAISYADANQIHQISFKAQSALVDVRSRTPAAPFTAPPAWVPEEVDTVARAISDLRKTAVAA
ncbi:MAG TPA: hypothetical protein VJ865_09250, partial [Gemmatimonadaceae bacterium]|nr:hypothetical protein [Gemmatimonadaceae bacterium]